MRNILAQEHLANIIFVRKAPVVNAPAKGVKHPIMVPHLFLAEFSKRSSEPVQIIKVRDHESLPVAVRCEVGFEAGISGSQLSAGLVAAATGGMRACAEWFHAGVTVCHVTTPKFGGGWEREGNGGECRSLAPRRDRVVLCAEPRLANAAVLTSGSHFGSVLSGLPNCLAARGS